MNPRNIILRNFAWSGEYDETSFTGCLHELCEWNANEYWLLEWSLYQLAGIRAKHPDMDWPVFRIFSHTFLSLCAHFDANDGFEIKHLDNLDVSALRERFQLVFEGYFSGAMPDQERCFDVINPLFAEKG